MSSQVKDFLNHHVTVKLATVVAFVFSAWTHCEVSKHGNTHDSDNAWAIPNRYVHAFVWMQTLLQFFYVLQHFSKDSAVQEKAHGTGWKYFAWALWVSLWGFFFTRGDNWLALVFIVLTVLTLTSHFWHSKTHSITPVSRWWFIHVAISSLPTAFSHWALLYTIWQAIGWDNFVSNVLADIFIWWFFLYPSGHLNRLGDWGAGLAFSMIAWGLFDADHGNKLQHWFAFAIAVLDTLYTFVVGYPDISSDVVESGPRNNEHAPLLSGDA